MLDLIIKLVLALVPTGIFVFLSTALGEIGVLYVVAFLVVGSAVVVCHRIIRLEEKLKERDNEENPKSEK